MWSGTEVGYGVIKASIVGATGFTGMVLTRLLSAHPVVELDVLTSTAQVGRRVDEVFPHTRVPGEYVAYDAQRLGDSEFVFVCYPHAAAHPVVAELVDAGSRVIDLSADFRLADPAEYPRWYGFEHARGGGRVRAPGGLPRQDLRRAAGGESGLFSHRLPAREPPAPARRRGGSYDRRCQVRCLRCGEDADREDALQQRA